MTGSLIVKSSLILCFTVWSTVRGECRIAAHPSQNRGGAAMTNDATSALGHDTGVAVRRVASQRPTVLPLYTADPDHSSLTFAVQHLHLTKVHGVFHHWNAALSYDPNDLIHSSVTVIVDIGSLDTDKTERDLDLKSDHFFDAERFPTAVFQSTALRKTPDGFIVDGVLQMHGVARPVTIPFMHTGSFESPSGRSEREGFEGVLTITRADYGIVHEGNILETVGAIGKDVAIEIELSAIRLKWEAFPFRGSDGDSTLGQRLWQTATSQGAEAAVTQYREILESEATPPPTSAQDMAILGSRLAAAGRSSAAAALVKLYAASRPEDADAEFLAGEALLRAQAFDEALTYYRSALQHSRERADAAERIRALMEMRAQTTLIGTEK